jgi:L-iditol 2-dehydrogenase
MTMLAATYTQGDRFRVEEVPVPSIEPDEVLLQVKASSICGTDMRIIQHGHRKLAPGTRIVLGHEFAGVLVKVGSRVKGYQEGQRVGIAPNIGCGRCDMCARGCPNMCPDYTAFGISFDGAHTEYVRIPANAIAQGVLIPLSEKMSWLEASLIEPLSCVVNGNRASRIALGDTVVIFGAGPIGLMHVFLAHCAGASQVFLADPDLKRIEYAKQICSFVALQGRMDEIREQIRMQTEGRGVDVAITACSVPSVQQDALTLLAPFGRLCLFGGLPRDSESIAINSNLIHYKNLYVTGVSGGSPMDFRIAQRMISAGKVPVGKLVSHTIPRSDIETAFNLSSNGTARMKVVISDGEEN